MAFSLSRPGFEVGTKSTLSKHDQEKASIIHTRASHVTSTHGSFLGCRTVGFLS